MLNNLTNFFNLIRGRKIKTTPDGSDLIPLGTRDPRYDGSYQPTAITVDDFVASLPPDINIYNSDGTLTGNRTVDLDSQTLIFNDGKVGINATPTVALQVHALAIPAGEAVARFGTTDSSAYLQVSNGTGTNGVFSPLLQGRQVGTSLHSAIALEGIIDAADDTGTIPITVFQTRLATFLSVVTRPLFQFRNYGLDIMTMLADGKVGIGTTTPTAKLEVNGPAFPGTESVAKFTVADDSASSLQIKNGTSAAATFVPEIIGTNSTNKIALGITGIATTDTGTEAVTIFQSLLASATAVVTRPIFQWKNFSTNVMTILADGKVGIGTATPGETLDVNGKTKTTTFQLTTTPTAGYVLTSDASGNGSWQLGGASGVFGIADASGVYTFYTTLTLAMAAATAGQTIEMFADVTETGAVSVILKNGVNINGNGHTYTLSNAGTSSCLIDNGVAVTSSILNLLLKRIGATTISTTDTNCLLVTGASRIDFNGSKAYASKAVAVIVNNSSAIVSNIYAYGDTGANGCLVVYVNAGKLENSTIYNNTNNVGYFTYALQSLGTIVNCTAYNTSGAAAIYNQGEMIDCVGYGSSLGIRNDGTAIGSTGFSSGGVGFTAYVNTTNQGCNGYSSGGVGFATNGSVNCRVINCSGFSTAGYGISAYNAFVQNSTAHSTSTYGLYLSNAGDGFGSVSNCTITADASAALFCNPSSVMSVSNSTILSRYNNAAGHATVLGLTVFSGAPIVDFFNNTFIVSNASANCLNSANAVNVKYASSVFRNSTTPVNANITQTIVNTEDNQGNILI